VHGALLIYAGACYPLTLTRTGGPSALKPGSSGLSEI